MRRFGQIISVNRLGFANFYLKTRTIFRKSTNSIKNGVDEFFSNSIVTTSVVISSIFLTINQLLGMIKLTMSSSFEMFFIPNNLKKNLIFSEIFLKYQQKINQKHSSDRINYGRFEVDHNSPRNISV